MLLPACLLVCAPPQSIQTGLTFAALDAPRIMVIGDSWATHIGQALHQTLGEAGDGDKTMVNLGVPGGKVSVFDSPYWLGLAQQILRWEPSIDTIHFSMGGVDFLTGWHKDDPPAVQAAFFDDVAQHIQHVAETLLAARPWAEVLLTGYDYMNFNESVQNNPGGACWKTWSQTFHEPSALEINQALMQMELRLQAIAETNPKVYYLRTIGFLQTAWGYPSEGIAPFSGRVPDDKLPTPPEAMGAQGGDCVHPSDEGYLLLAQHYYNGYYRARFHPEASFPYSGLVPGSAGAVNTLTASGMAPGEPVMIVFGLTPKMDFALGCAHAFLGIGQIVGGFTLNADASGTAGTVFHIGAEMQGRIVLTQAVQPLSCKASSVVASYL